MRKPLLVFILAVVTALPLASQELGADSARADSAARRGTLLVFPFLFYQPETSIGGGGGALRSYRTARDARPSTTNLFLVVTAKRQFSVTASSERYSPANRWRTAWEAGWSRFPDVFYGLGNETQADDEESFTLEHRRAWLDARRAVRPGIYLGGAAYYQRSLMRKTDDSGVLRGGTIPGSTGASLVALGVVATLDRRDHFFVPSRGSFVTLSTRTAATAIGSDLSYTRVELDARRYARFGGGVVAGQLLVTGISGDAPFFDLANLGGASVMRGVFEGRYRDRSRVVTQLEYRRHLWRKLGATAFLSAGQVARDPEAFSLASLHYAGGAGIRILMSASERVNARIDFGFGPRSSGLYFGFAEAF